MSGGSKTYVIDSDQEPLRLERQAELADITLHLPYIPLDGARNILDVGCGSGSMTRLLAKSAPQANVVGVDTNKQYLDFARRKATEENLQSIEFREADAFSLPFADQSFDVVWSKYLLQWLNEPKKALAAFQRVTRAGKRGSSLHF